MGDGAPGFGAALRQVCREAREQRRWVHEIANVLDTLPLKLRWPAPAGACQGDAAWDRGVVPDAAPGRVPATEGLGRFAGGLAARCPKAAACLAKDAEAPPTLFGLPAEHWRHLRTTNRIAWYPTRRRSPA